MNLTSLVIHGWNAQPVVIVGCAGALSGYAVLWGRRGRWPYALAALLLVLLALVSPLDALARGVLFSAHMAQHLILLLVVPALLLLSLPKAAGRRPRRHWPALLGWALGIGAMWIWHIPSLCDAAASNPGVGAGQTLSLLGAGTAFWWPILAPSEGDRLIPGLGIAYLFTACLACTALGIVITFTPVAVCPIFCGPATAASPWADFRVSVGVDRDRQFGGLLMWVPMCLVYLTAILLKLARWLGEPGPGVAVPGARL